MKGAWTRQTNKRHSPRPKQGERGNQEIVCQTMTKRGVGKRGHEVAQGGSECSGVSEVRKSWVQIPAQPLISCVTGADFFFFLTYFWLRWVFIAARGLSRVALSGGYSSLQYTGFSLRWLLVARASLLLAGFSSCGARA